MKIDLAEYRTPESPYNYLNFSTTDTGPDELLWNISRKYVEYLEEKNTGAPFVNTEDPMVCHLISSIPPPPCKNWYHSVLLSLSWYCFVLVVNTADQPGFAWRPLHG